MKRLLAVLSLLTCALLISAAHAQSILPNLNYSGQLNAACTNANTACSNAVFVTGLGATGNPGSFGAGAALDLPAANYSAAQVTVSGTYAGVTLNFEFADSSGTNYFQEVCARTDINLLETSEVLPSNQVRAWQCPVWGNTRFRVRASAYTSGNANIYVTLTQAAIDPSLVVAASIANIAGASDPCQDVSAIKQFAVINISTATTTQLVANLVLQNVYLCGYQAVAGAGTNPSLQFVYGTGSNCATAQVVLTGAMATGVTVSTTVPGPIFQAGGGNTLFRTPANFELCVTTGGTTPNFQGYITYVQQ